MIPTRSILLPNELRTASLDASRERFLHARSYAVAATERLGELYTELDEAEADDAATLRDAEIETAQACACYDEALARVGWEANEINRAIPGLPNEKRQ
ncbi:MAG TPA: hypothetical protein VHW03_04495 [Chthoniobacterales bacterium]|jgi:hypothetical protein|nr:hypothetical protein [Chthoniobacterales bacterium]